MSARWILVADGSRARLFQEGPAGSTLMEIADFVNTEGRATNRELVTAPQGLRYGKGGAGQPHSPIGEPSEVDHATEQFAQDLIRYLEHARTENKLGGLALVAAPKFLGLLRKNMGKELATHGPGGGQRPGGIGPALNRPAYGRTAAHSFIAGGRPTPA